MTEQVRQMFSDIAPRYDITNDVLSFGVHRLWRAKALNYLGVSSGEKLVDICTGTGDFAFLAAELVGPSGEVVGLDFSANMLSAAEAKVESRTKQINSNLSFMQGDAQSLPFSDNSFDYATIGFGIRNVDSPLAALKEIRRVLQPNGKVAILEFGQPTLPGFSLAYRLYSRYLIPIIGGVLTGNRSAYEYLPKTSATFPAGDKFLQLMADAEFKGLRFIPLFGGVAYIYLGHSEKVAKPTEFLGEVNGRV